MVASCPLYFLLSALHPSAGAPAACEDLRRLARVIIITVTAVVIHHDHAMMMTIVITSASMAIMNADDEAHDDDEVQPMLIVVAIVMNTANTVTLPTLIALNIIFYHTPSCVRTCCQKLPSIEQRI